MNEDVARIRLKHIADRTANADGFEPAAWWDGDRAGERRAIDDLKAGKLHWQSARCIALLGLEKLEEGDIESATEFACIASGFYIEALEAWLARVKPSDLPSMAPAKRRGRPPRKN